MLFQFLKLFGLDVPAKIDSVAAIVELRLEQASDRVKEVVQEAAVMAALSVSATITGAIAVGVGLIALYRYTAEAAGAYVGLGVEAAILIAMTIVLTTAAIIKRKSLSPTRIELPCYAAAAAGAPFDPGVIMKSTPVNACATEPHSSAQACGSSTGATPPVSTAFAGDLVEPLAFFLSKVPAPPKFGNPYIDELIGNLRASAHGTVDEAIDRTANVIRHGSRTDLLIVLTGAAFIGWMLTRHSQQSS
jgi:hypothetical protein